MVYSCCWVQHCWWFSRTQRLWPFSAGIEFVNYNINKKRVESRALFGDSVPLLADKNTLEISVCGVCLWLCLHTPVCTRSVYRSKKRFVGVLPCFSTYSLETVSHWIWSSLSRLCWLGSARLCSPMPGMCDHATWPCGFWGIKLRFSHVHSKCSSYLLIGPHRSTNCKRIPGWHWRSGCWNSRLLELLEGVSQIGERAE